MRCSFMKKIEIELPVKYYGDNLVIYIPKSVASALKIENGDMVSILVSDKNVIKN